MVDSLLHPSAYQPHVKESFTAHCADGRTVALTLEEVATKIDDEVQRCFVLLFGGALPVLQQGLYTVSHPSLGRFELFLVPLSPRRGQALYEAAFNVLKEGA